MSESHTEPAASHRSVLDDAIARAVRRMVQIDGPPGLRRRVEARITAATPRSSAPWLRYVGAAAIALLVLMLGLRRERPEVPQSVDRTVKSEPTRETPPSRDSEPVASTAAVDPAVPGLQTGRKPARKPHVDVIPMPKIHNVFGDPANTVAAANVPGGEGVRSPRVTETTPAPDPIAIEGLSVPPLTPEAKGGSTPTGHTPSQLTAAGPKPQQGPGPDVRRRNVSIEFAIGDQTGAAAPIKKVVTLIVADRQKGSVRSSGNAVMPRDEPASLPLEHETLNVD